MYLDYRKSCLTSSKVLLIHVTAETGSSECPSSLRKAPYCSKTWLNRGHVDSFYCGSIGFMFLGNLFVSFVLAENLCSGSKPNLDTKLMCVSTYHLRSGCDSLRTQFYQHGGMGVRGRLLTYRLCNRYISMISGIKAESRSIVMVIKCFTEVSFFFQCSKM